jgi:transposase
MTSVDIRQLIREMNVANPLWGAPRIHGELLKLGIDVGQTTVARYMAKRGRPPSQGWKTFLRNHADAIASIDLFVVPTISFRLLRARRAKTDGVDVERLLRSLMAYLRGEPKVWSVVRVSSVAEEDVRRLHRERGRLINERIQHVNRIKGLLAIHGIYDYQPLRRDKYPNAA